MKLTELNEIFTSCKLECSGDGEGYVAIRVHIDGFPEDEIIVNKYKNIDTKLDYYNKTYDENCNHKFSKGIRIVNATWTYYFDEIELSLAGE
jgi:hypothetical protein